MFQVFYDQLALLAVLYYPRYFKYLVPWYDTIWSEIFYDSVNKVLFPVRFYVTLYTRRKYKLNLYSGFRYCTAKITCYKLGLIVPLIILSRTLNFHTKRLRIVVQENIFTGLQAYSNSECIWFFVYYIYISPSTLHAKGWEYYIIIIDIELIYYFHNFFAHPLYRPSDFLTDFHNIFLIYAELYYLWLVRKISCSYSF